MDMTRALEKLREEFPDVAFEPITVAFDGEGYGISADAKNFHFAIANQPSPLCCYVRVKMCCQAMK